MNFCIVISAIMLCLYLTAVVCDDMKVEISNLFPKNIVQYNDK